MEMLSKIKKITSINQYVIICEVNTDQNNDFHGCVIKVILSFKMN